jgi:hypothetical protein
MLPWPPLSPHKLSVADFHPLIASYDKYLSSWHASLLNRVGRLTLCTSVLSSLPIHYMSSLGLHKTVIKAIDHRQRAFFWTGEDTCHGSKCLVAWEDSCTSKLEGRLGIKGLHLQNCCLLMKFIDKIFSNDPAPWKDWLLLSYSPFDDSFSGSSLIWNIINDELDTFRSITKVDVHNGAATSF